MKYEPKKPLAKYKKERMIFGVCSGLARKFGGEAIYYRIGFLCLVFLVYGSGTWIYLLLALIMPNRE